MGETPTDHRLPTEHPGVIVCEVWTHKCGIPVEQARANERGIARPGRRDRSALLGDRERFVAMAVSAGFDEPEVPSKTFARALQLAWGERTVTIVGDQDAAACGPDGCAVPPPLTEPQDASKPAAADACPQTRQIRRVPSHVRKRA
ncbi:hypothetical protein GIY30_10395 [Gordonia sp. HNM0687]|uniref:Uncharacterized protein n=1 Tax=Gordonia mangrovi TaxID=2665643 RepID=A0A6L7GQY3_9ACTN|nr:hypothetical protein [Gordonia mangrovi]MXP21757.1 hypothetical protein [Gordonia mangrovi]UVF80486.1 hypothetical protein NWF22_11995 [Gordonia mangrovi]